MRVYLNKISYIKKSDELKIVLNNLSIIQGVYSSHKICMCSKSPCFKRSLALMNYFFTTSNLSFFFRFSHKLWR